MELPITSRAKTEAVLRLLKGESVQEVSEELGVSARRVERWKARFLEAGFAELAKRSDDPHKSWVSKHSSSIWQWLLVLVALFVLVSILTALGQIGLK